MALLHDQLVADGYLPREIAAADRIEAYMSIAFRILERTEWEGVDEDDHATRLMAQVHLAVALAREMP